MIQRHRNGPRAFGGKLTKSEVMQKKDVFFV